MGFFSGLLGAAGGLVGALGKGKSKGPTEISGFASLSPELQDYLTTEILPKIKQFGASGYKGLPLRRIDESDGDPVFGSKARQYLQQYKDMQFRDSQKAPPVAPVEPDSSSSGLSGIAQAFLQTNPMMMANGTSNKYWNAYNAVNKTIPDKKKVMDALGKSLSEGNTSALVALLGRG